jgi:hypothetical protein
VGPEPCLSLATSIDRRREREWLFKSHCASWSLETVAEKAQSRLDEILTEAAYIQIEDFDGTHNWTLSIKQASAQHGSYR